jgi:outer membrane protein OmpA-like peptidoglycan-associated protein
MSSRARCTAAGGLALLLLAACGGDAEEAEAGPAAEAPRAPGGGAAAAAAPSTAEPWVDPEPPDAQARAVAAVAEAWNADKTSRLAMKIQPLVDRRSGIAGFRSEVAADGVPLNARLARLGAEISDTEVIIRLPGSVLFDFDSDTVRSDAEPVLAEVASVLAAYARRPARIEGHTDSIASDAYNLDLSRRRAESVRTWLAAHGVAAGRLSTAGHGEARPVADNGTAAGRQRNRRVEIVIAAED